MHSRNCIWICRLRNAGHFCRPQWNVSVFTCLSVCLSAALLLRQNGFWVRSQHQPEMIQGTMAIWFKDVFFFHFEMTLAWLFRVCRSVTCRGPWKNLGGGPCSLRASCLNCSICLSVLRHRYGGHSKVRSTINLSTFQSLRDFPWRLF